MKEVTNMNKHYITTEFKHARNWDKKKVRTLGGSYANAMKTIYGYDYQDVDLYKNRKAYYERQNNRIQAVYNSELV
jgi:hypothetical protein